MDTANSRKVDCIESGILQVCGATTMNENAMLYNLQLSFVFKCACIISVANNK